VKILLGAICCPGDLVLTRKIKNFQEHKHILKFWLINCWRPDEIFAPWKLTQQPKQSTPYFPIPDKPYLLIIHIMKNREFLIFKIYGYD